MMDRIVYAKPKSDKKKKLTMAWAILFFAIFLLIVSFSHQRWLDRLRNIVISDTLETFVEQWYE